MSSGITLSKRTLNYPLEISSRGPEIGSKSCKMALLGCPIWVSCARVQHACTHMSSGGRGVPRSGYRDATVSGLPAPFNVQTCFWQGSIPKHVKIKLVLRIRREKVMFSAVSRKVINLHILDTNISLRLLCILRHY